jgi:hypothetical protein
MKPIIIFGGQQKSAIEKYMIFRANPPNIFGNSLILNNTVSGL